LLVPDKAAVASGAFNAVGFAYAVATPDDGGDAAPLPPPPPLERYVPPFELPVRDASLMGENAHIALLILIVCRSTCQGKTVCR